MSLSICIQWNVNVYEPFKGYSVLNVILIGDDSDKEFLLCLMLCT